MVGLEVIRKDMETLLEQDKSLNAIEVNADSLDEALADAATQLDARIVNLEYEILERGSDGFLGLAKKPWKLRIYQNAASLAKKKKSAAQDAFATDELYEEVKIVDQDGLYYIRHFGDEIMLKVIMPVGKGRHVDAKDIINDARRPDTVSIEEGKIKEYAKKGTNGNYEPIGLYKHIKAGDAMLIIDVSKDEMEA
ncbi:MAG: Jag N-terminal domain-containing protein, partial [Treponema sp.]|nr:Jag N-terminal domain-containing protein [Treponema sp.]